MDISDKLLYIYSLYDFDESRQIQYDTICLLLRISVKGLCKLFPSKTLNNMNILEIDAIAENQKYCTLTPKEFEIYCSDHPILFGWLKHFSIVKKEHSIPQGTFFSVEEKNVSVLNDQKFVNKIINLVENSVTVTKNDFCEFYTASVRGISIPIVQVISLMMMIFTT